MASYESISLISHAAEGQPGARDSHFLLATLRDANGDAARDGVVWIVGLLVVQALAYGVASQRRGFINRFALTVLIVTLFMPLAFFDPTYGFVPAFEPMRIVDPLFYGPALSALSILLLSLALVRVFNLVWRATMICLAALLLLNAWWFLGIIEAVN